MVSEAVEVCTWSNSMPSKHWKTQRNVGRAVGLCTWSGMVCSVSANRALSRTWPSCINEPQNNHKNMKWLVEPISVLVLHDALLKEEGKCILGASVQSAYRANRVSIDSPYRCFLGPLVLKGLHRSRGCLSCEQKHRKIVIGERSLREGERCGACHRLQLNGRSRMP
jgi:hypothetical protein